MEGTFHVFRSNLVDQDAKKKGNIATIWDQNREIGDITIAGDDTNSSSIIVSTSLITGGFTTDTAERSDYLRTWNGSC